MEDANLFYFRKQIRGFNDDEIEIGDSTLEATDCTLKNIEDDGTVRPVTEHTANYCEQTSNLLSKKSEAVESEDDHLRFNNVNPVLNTSPTKKSKKATDVTVPVKFSQRENLNTKDFIYKFSCQIVPLLQSNNRIQQECTF